MKAIPLLSNLGILKVFLLKQNAENSLTFGIICDSLVGSKPVYKKWRHP
jgi:hypothetical protein